MIDVNASSYDRKRTIYRVECKKGIECPGMPGTKGYDTEQEAAAAWNTRAPQPPAAAEVERMKNPTFIEIYADGLHFLNLAKLFAINITMTKITFFFDEVREVTIERYSYGREKFDEMRKKVVCFLNTGSIWEEDQEGTDEL